MTWRPFIGLSGIGKIKDPVLRRMLSDLNDWARQVREEDQVPMPGRVLQSIEPTGLEDTYDNVTTTLTTDAFPIADKRHFEFRAALTESGAATSMTFQAEFSNDGTNWWVPFGSSYTVTILTGSMPRSGYMSGVLCDRLMRVTATAAGTDAVNTITVADGALHLGD